MAPNQYDTSADVPHVGGTENIIHATLKFDDAATNSLPSILSFPQIIITNGVYKPTSYAPPTFP